MLFSGLCSLRIHTIAGSAAGKQASHRGEVKNTFSTYTNTTQPQRGETEFQPIEISKLNVPF